MTTQEAAAFGGTFGALIMIMLILVIAFYVFYIIAFWKIFNKMGEPGWKSLIPFYNVYVQFDKTWETKYFWISLVTMIVGYIIIGVGGDGSIMAIIGGIVALVGCVILIMDYYYLVKSFGKGVGFFIATIFFEFICTLILAFGSAEYLGNAGKGEIQ